MSFNLNYEQNQAVTHSGGPLLVIAGPGSGKTRVIIERVMHLLRSGMGPSEILCLTFSEKAAEEMRQRLEKRTDIADMQIGTFHSFAKELLEDNVLDSGIGMSSGVIKRSAQLVWGLKHIDDFKFGHLEVGNNAVDLVESIIDGISTFKDELVSPEELQDYIRTRLETEQSDEKRDALLKLSDLCKVYFKYQEFQRSRAVIDFDDMVVQSVDLLKRKPSVLSKYQKKFKHILVDEFQDNNFAQLELVKLIGRDGNITAVGDDDQSIYRFQGAYLTNFRDFTSSFPATTVVILSRNYRSTKNIVSLAGQLLEGLPERQQKKLASENEEGERVTVARCESESAEVEFVVGTIRNLLGKKVTRRDGTDSPLAFRDFVILSRRRAEGKKFAKALKAHGIPTTFIGESNIFASPVIRDMMAFLRIANRPATSGIDITRLLKNHGISETNIARINHAAMRKARADPSNIDYVFDTLKQCDDLGVTQKDEVGEIASQIRRVIELESQAAVSDMVYHIMMSVSDLYKKSILSDTPENRRNQLVLKEFYNIATEYESLNPQNALDDFISYLTLMGQFDVELKEFLPEDSVQVTTIHQSKGREFPVVFIVDVATNKLPLRYQAKKFYVPADLSKGLVRAEDERELHLQEERRLLYVAMTRAQNLLYMTYAKRYGQNVRETKPSMFLEELGFEKNPLVSLVDHDGKGGVLHLEEERAIEKIKLDLQNRAASSLYQMHLKSAVQRIADLAKVRHFEESGTTAGFDPKEVLDVDGSDDELDLLLEGKKVSLVNRDDLRLSASKIGTYLECPLKFKFSHILQVPTPPKSYFDVGTAVHAVAEHLTKLRLEGVVPTEDVAFEILDKEWRSEGFESRTQEAQKKEEARQMVRTYMKWEMQNPNSPIAVEKRFSMDIGGVQFNGFIDRVERTPDGKYAVVDFKTGGAYENSRTIRENPQMNVYALGIDKLYGQLPEKTSLFYLKEDKMVENPISAPQVQKVKAVIEEQVRSILDEKFEATPSYQTCRMCDFKSICDKKETEE